LLTSYFFETEVLSLKNPPILTVEIARIGGATYKPTATEANHNQEGLSDPSWGL
jgi:hypothetical protein